MPFPTRFDVLPKNQKLVLEHLEPAIGLGFCLYGGTALALRFGHRRSVDFDFFSGRQLDKAVLLAAIPLLENGTQLQAEKNSCVALVKPSRTGAEVKLSFFGRMTFGRVGQPELSQDGRLLVASVRDLMATKLKALFDRAEARDYIDIVEMLERGANLSAGISDAMALFPSFSPQLSLKSLCYFGERSLSGLGAGYKRVLTGAVKATEASTRRFTASKRASSSLTLAPDEMKKEISLLKTMARSDSGRPRGRSR